MLAHPQDPEQGKYKLDEVLEAEALLLGRVTYEGFAAAWPSRTDEAGFADKMNSMPKYVVSSTLEELEWNNSTLLRGDVAAEVSKLKQEEGATSSWPAAAPSCRPCSSTTSSTSTG